jgi:succinate dehydrogenase / fumarate reductase, flavoprotein subunit
MSRIRSTNVLVIGAGGAGLRAAIAARECDVDVLVLGRRPRRDAHTVLAAGGINAALGTVDPDDSWEQHAADTLVEGQYLGDPTAVELLCREAGRAVEELVEWGADFTRQDDGRLDQRFFGAHRYRRTCYAADWTGRSLLHTLASRAEAHGIEVLDGHCVSHLLVRDKSCFGAFGFDIATGERTTFLADAVVLAAGGHTRSWRRSSSRRDENTGDGPALALRAGCAVANLELVQFHPTGMVHPDGWEGTLVTEAVRGRGGRLLNSEGERFMERYDADRMELSTRDRVALANYTEIQEGRAGPHGGVFLDVTHLGRDAIVEQLPRMRRQFIEAQLLDIAAEPMEVAPTAHYTMGGVVVEPHAHATDIEHLYAAGECTSGVHGANRLGGNSLAEVMVFGRRAGESAAASSRERRAIDRDPRCIAAADDDLDRWSASSDELPLPVLEELRDIMWEGCGVVRDAEGLATALDRLDALAPAVDTVDGSPTAEGATSLARVVALRAAILAARATVSAALERTESRGAHQRCDHPDLDDDLRVDLVVRLDDGDRFHIERRPIAPVPSHLRQVLDAPVAAAEPHRLLE